MKFRLITSAIVLFSATACTFFEEPIDDLTSITPPAAESTASAPLPPPVTPPTLPTPPTPATPAAQETTTTSGTSGGTYLTVSTIFDIPESVPNLSFVHFTSRDKKRETAVCKALLSAYEITAPTAVPGNAANLIVWPIAEDTSANKCSAMVKSHEPLDISNKTAEVVKSDAKGPFLMSRNTPQQKRMIHDFSSVGSGNFDAALSEWQQMLNSDVGSWPPVVIAR